ncbi:MAG: DUF4209 domain-containing protein, partial [Methanoculleus sp.]|nr:DUF4209 domain-containing protein [Methanoculleus sp.]
EVLDRTERDGYFSMWQAFHAAAQEATAEGRQSHAKVLWLLGDACSMMLSPKSINEPFKPAIVMRGQRSVIPENLSDSDITFLSEIVDSIDDPWLKARLADLIWLRKRPRDVRFALMAIDSYRSIPIDRETWVFEGQECCERAIGLARMLKARSGDRLKEIEEAIIKTFDSTSRQDGALILNLADLLLDNTLGLEKRPIIAQKLEALAREFDAEGDLHSAREFFKASAKWFKAAGDNQKSIEMTVAVAESFVKEAEARIDSDKPSHMIAAISYEEAIQTYRTIPRSERPAHRVDERLKELQLHLNESGKKALDEMGVISTPGIDLSQYIEDARSSVHGKSAIEALKAFAGLQPYSKVKELRQQVIEKLRKYPLQAIIPEIVMGRDGRVIAKRSGMGLSDIPSEEDETGIRAEMIHDHGIMVGMVVPGRILPALEVLQLEHRLREPDFIYLASRSPIVPIGRERLFGMALFAGYDNDFVTALHLLVPQIEHMVRYHLKSAGVKTTTLDSRGIETENGLSTLIELPECEKIFGEDLTFEIKALFCDACGPNLRNELAHGLLDDKACQTAYAVYAWWLGLKLVFNTFWNAARKIDGVSEEDAA